MKDILSTVLRQRRRKGIGVHVSAKNIRMASIVRESGAASVRSASAMPAETSLKETLDRFFRDTPWADRECSFAVPLSEMWFATAAIPAEIRLREIGRAIPLHCEAEPPAPWNDMLWRWQEISAGGRETRNRKVAVFGVSKRWADGLADACAEAGIRIRGLRPEPLAAQAALRFSRNSGPDYIAFASTSLLHHADGFCFWQRWKEGILCHMENIPGDGSKGLEAVGRFLAEKRLSEDQPVVAHRVYLSGEGWEPGLASQAGENLAAHVEVLDPFGGFSEASVFPEDRPAYAVCCGLALWEIT